MEQENIGVAGEPAAFCRGLLIGVGGGGGSAVARMARGGRDGPAAVAVNTDAQALESCGLPRTLLIGRKSLKGFGAGGDPALGRQAAEEDADPLRELLAGQDLALIVTTLGGGTGSGAAPVVARLAREQGALALVFATLPFDFEGERRQAVAHEALKELRKQASAVFALPNQLLAGYAADEPRLEQGLAEAGRLAGAVVTSLWRMLAQPGLINLNLADLRNLFEHCGPDGVLCCAEAAGAGRAARALEALQAHPLLEGGGVLAHSSACLLNINGGPDLALAEVRELVTRLRAATRPDLRVFLGVTLDPAWDGRLGLNLIAAEKWHGHVAGRKPASGPKEAAPAAEQAGQLVTGGMQQKRQLELELSDRGHFIGVEPTVDGGEDLDTPTYIRRGIRLSCERVSG